MRKNTSLRYLNILKDIKKSGVNISQYCKKHGINYNSLTIYASNVRNSNNITNKTVKEFLALYNELTAKTNKNGGVTIKNICDTDDKSETFLNRGDDGLIVNYEYKIYRKDKTCLHGILSREDMATIYRLYSYYGDALTQRQISRYFVDLSLIDFKRVLRAFNITKASAPFPQHIIEERTEDELRDIQLREKENSFLRKAENDQIKNNEKLLKKYAYENIELKKQLQDLSEFKVTIPDDIKPTVLKEYEEVGQSITLYLSDIHLGAAVTTGSLYDENKNYGFDEAKRRLTEVLNRLNEFGAFDTVNLVLMGDNVDCCGVYGKTSRLDHAIPENMDAREQANKFIELMMWFIGSIASEQNQLCNHINLYSVPCGNHGGLMEYMCNKTLMGYVNAKFPSIKTTMFEEFYGVFEFNSQIMVITHGKDEQYMRKGLPLNLDDKTKIMLYEWLNEHGIHSNNVHIVKGDLHSDSLNSCKRLDYRNVLSLFGASDYSAYNYSANSYGVSYDLFIGNIMTRGTFENML